MTTTNHSLQSLVTRTMRAAVKIGDDYVTIEETITLPPTASDEQIAQAVATGLRIYEAQRAAVDIQVRALRDQTASHAAPVQIREPDAPASEKQRAYMEYLLKELEWDTERLVAFAAERSLNVLTLTKREVSELIDDLKGVLAGVDDAPGRQSTDARTITAAEAEADVRATIQAHITRINAEQLAVPTELINADLNGWTMEQLVDHEIELRAQMTAAHAAPTPTHATVLPIGERATPRQIRALERLVEERGIDIQGELRARFGERGLQDLSMDEAGQLLSEWQQRPRQLRPRAEVNPSGTRTTR